MILCSITDCGGEHIARGYCSFHYKRWQIHGDALADKPKDTKSIRLRNQNLICISEGCDRPAKRAQMCFAHYQRFKKTGNTNPNKPITVRKGWYKHKSGYVVIPAKGHPNANKAGSIMEHIKIMSNHLGRPLIKEENVHHRNGKRDDNRIENLELWLKRQPAGQRVSDLIHYANEIINLYGDNPRKYE